MTDKSRKDGFLSNGLLTTAEHILNSYKEGVLTEEHYIKEMRKLFGIYEQLKGVYND